MLMRVGTLVFLFLIRLRFPTSKSIPNIIKERYGREILKLIRKFEKVDFKYKKAILDLDFLYCCSNNNLILTFLKFNPTKVGQWRGEGGGPMGSNGLPPS